MEQYKEIAFEKEFAEHLAAHGWHYSPSDAGYDRGRAVFPRMYSAGSPTRSPISWRRWSRKAPAASRNSSRSCWTGS